MNSGAVPRAGSRKAVSASYRRQVASRLAAALVGGYLVANATAVLLARLLYESGMNRADGVIAAALFSFLAYPAAILWAFAARGAARAWLGLLAVSLVSAAMAWLLGRGGVA